jgi:DNA topoisomerase I
VAASSHSKLLPASDELESAKTAGLRYISPNGHGIHRNRRGKGFVYTNSAGNAVRDAKTLTRIRSLVIPPAWQNVWICSDALGHIQAIGKDKRGRKQYRYHPQWRKVRDQNKYDRLIDFAKALPKIRHHVRRDIRQPGLPREKVLGAVVQLLEITLIRVGNEEYARTNHSYGLTTMRNRHVAVKGASIHFEFRGKSGIEHTVDLHDSRLARIISACQHLPGQELFEYVDDDGTRHSIRSDEVNDYLQGITKEDFTAKEFRTWAGTVLAVTQLRQLLPFRSQTQAKKNVVTAIRSVAKRLGNTIAVCRKCYVHPVVVTAYLDGTLLAISNETEATGSNSRSLRAAENAMVKLLRDWNRRSIRIART